MTKSLPNSPSTTPIGFKGRTYVAAFIVLSLILSAKLGFGQTNVFPVETIGTPGGTTAITTYATGTAPATFTNKGLLTYAAGDAAAPGDVRATGASNTYAGASGGGNVFITTTLAASRGFSMESINANGLSGLQVSFGLLRIVTTTTLSLDYWNGTSWVPTGVSLTGGSNNAWQLIGPVGLPPAAAINGLKLRWIKGNEATSSYRIDDIKLTSGSTTAYGTYTPSAFSATQGSPSTAQVVTVGGELLTGNITVTPPAGYEVSTTSATTGFGATATVTQTAGTAAPTSVWVRLTGASAGTFNGNLTLTSAGAPTQNIALSGSVSAAAPTVSSTPTTLSNFTTSQGLPSTAQSISVSGAGLTANLTVGPLSGYEFSTTSATAGFSASAVSLTPTAGNVAATTVWVRLTGVAQGTFNGPLPVASTGATTVNVTFNGTVGAPAPTITSTSTSLATKFVAAAGTPSQAQTFTVSGVNLTDDIQVGPATGYEFSLSIGSGYLSSLTLLQSGGSVVSTPIYARLASGAVGTYNGPLPLTSTGAPTVNVTVTGQVYKALSSFTTGNIVVARVGETSTALSSNSAPYFLIEYTKAGVKVDSGLVPVAASGSNYGFTVSGNSTTSGLLNLSPDRKYLIIAGTTAPIGLASGSSSPGSLSATYPKVIGRINYQGIADLTTTFNNAYNNNNLRSATTLLGNKFWTSGTGDLNTGGVYFGALGATAGTAIVTGTGQNNNTRYIQISNSQLYISTGSGTTGIYRVGTGLPESASSFSSAITTPAPEGFFFVDADAGVPGNDVVYVARDGGTGSQGIAKFKFNGTTWSPAGVLDGVNLFGVYAEMNGTSADVYFTSATSVYKYTDANASTSTLSGTIASLATVMVVAPTNTNFHGISLTPENVVNAGVDLTFTTPSPTSVPQGTLNHPIYSTQVDVTLATATFTGVTYTTSGSYASSDVDNFKLWLSADANWDNGDILLATDNTLTGAGETIDFTGLGQAIPVGTRYLLITANVSGCATVGTTVGITSTPILNYGFGSANVSGTPVAGTNNTVTAGTPSPVTNLALTRGQQNLPITWDPNSCPGSQYLVVVHTAPITSTPSGGGYVGNLNYSVAGNFNGANTGKVVYFGTNNSIDVTGLTVGTLYYVKVFTYLSSYSSGVQDTSTAKNTTFYSRASGTVQDPIWTLSPTGGTLSTVAALGGFASNKNVVIQAGHNITYNASGSVTCLNLTVATGASFGTVSTSQSYVNLYGNLVNNGTIGGPVGGGNAEFTSFNLSGFNQTWSGNGTTTISRLRKNGGVEPITNLTLNTNVTATFAGTAVYNSSTTSKLNITVAANKTLNISDAAGSLSLDGLAGNDAGQIAGSLTVNGKLMAGSLTLQNNNTTATYGTAFTVGSAGNVLVNNFTADLNGGQGMTMSIAAGGTLRVRGSLNVVTGTVSTNGIKFEYNPLTGSSGRLLALTGGANVTGTVTVEQKITAAPGWHFMTAPVKNATFAQWSELTPVISPKNNATLFTYTEGDTTRGTYNGFLTEYAGWKVVSSLAGAMNPGDAITGYRVYGRNPFVTSNGVVSVTGQPFTGTVSRAVTKTPTGWDGGGWNLIGNPYASDINWDNVVASNASLGIDQALYIWNGTTKSYGSYVGGSGTNGVTKYVPTAQGFMVYVSGTPGNLNFEESHKTTVAGTFLREAAVGNELHIKMTNGTTTSDEAVVKFALGATRSFDIGMDSRKLNNPSFNISSLPESNLNLQINAMPEVVGTETLKLKVTAATVGTYKLNFSGMDSFNPGTVLYLKDNYLGTLTDLSANPEYTFSVSAVAASAGSDRFELVVSASVTGVTKPVAKPSFNLYPNPAQNGKAFMAINGLNGKANAMVIGTDGAVKASFQIESNGLETVVELPSTLTKGVYTVRLSNGSYTSTQKLVVE